MKKSNLIILSAIGAIFIFSIAFQLNVNRHLRHAPPKKETVKIISEERKISSFNKISVSHKIEVYFTQDSVTKIKVEAPEKTIPNTITKVENETLIIEKVERFKNKNTVKVLVYGNQLDALKVNSGAYFETIGKVSGKELKLEFSNDTKAILELSYDHVECKAESGSQVKFRGNTSNIEFSN